jgi:hypothetical protein
MKHVKLFESFHEDFLIEKAFVEFLYSLDESLEEIFSMNEAEERVEWDDEKEEKSLTRGEKAALARGHNLMSEEQMAVLYLIALGKTEDEIEKYITRIDGMLSFADLDPKTQKPKFTMAAIADAIGLVSNRTMSRTINKFKNLIEGVGETEAEAIYPKLLKAFQKFGKMNTDSVAALGAECIQDPSYNVNREAAEKYSSKTAAARAEAKNKAVKQGEAVYTLYKSLQSAMKAKGLSSPEKILNLSIAKINNETGADETVLRNALTAYLKDKGITL